MIFGVEGVDPARRAQLMDLLEIDQEWRLNKVSDGQRRRVQICMGLLKPYQVGNEDVPREPPDVLSQQSSPMPCLPRWCACMHHVPHRRCLSHMPAPATHGGV